MRSEGLLGILHNAPSAAKAGFFSYRIWHG